MVHLPLIQGISVSWKINSKGVLCMIRNTKNESFNEEFNIIWNHTHDAIFTIGYDGAVLNANRAFTELLGYELNEVLGIARPPFFTEEFTVKQHQQQLQNLKKGQDTPNYETTRKTKDGNLIYVLASYRAVNKNGILAVAMYKDVTEEVKLRENDYCYRLLVEHSPVAIIVYSEGVISFTNPYAIELLGGKSSEELIGKSILEFANSDSDDLDSDFIKIFREGKRIEPEPFIQKLRKGNGTEFWAEITAIPVTYNRKPVIQAIIRDVTDKKKYDEFLEVMAYQDPLTGLTNRRSFMNMLNGTFVEYKMKGGHFALLYVDLDDFKSINDNYGHEIGDDLLVKFASRIIDTVRSTDVVGRIGGDEFIVILRDSEKDRLIELLNRLQENFRRPYVIQDIEIHATCSMGVAIFPDHADSTKQLIRNADFALYQAKEAKNRYIIYNDQV